MKRTFSQDQTKTEYILRQKNDLPLNNTESRILYEVFSQIAEDTKPDDVNSSRRKEDLIVAAINRHCPEKEDIYDYLISLIDLYDDVIREKIEDFDIADRIYISDAICRAGEKIVDLNDFIEDNCPLSKKYISMNRRFIATLLQGDILNAGLKRKDWNEELYKLLDSGREYVREKNLSGILDFVVALRLFYDISYIY